MNRKYKKIVLRENEVLYVYEKTRSHYNESKIIDQPTFRFENIGGVLYETALPSYFIVESDVNVFVLEPNTNLHVVTADTRYDYIIKKENDLDSDLDTYRINNNEHTPELTPSEYVDYVDGLAQSIKPLNNSPAAVAGFDFLNRMLEICDDLNINIEDFAFNGDFEGTISHMFNTMSRNRTKRIAELESEKEPQ